jgi:hypothetical protein
VLGVICYWPSKQGLSVVQQHDQDDQWDWYSQ